MDYSLNMRFIFVGLLLSVLPSLPAHAASKSQRHNLLLREISEKELSSLGQKLAKSLKSCKHKSPDDLVLVTVTNSTDEFIDKTKLANLIRDSLKPDKAVPDISPFYEVRTKFSALKSEMIRKKKREYKGVYTLRADVYQDDKRICEREEIFEKTGILE